MHIFAWTVAIALTPVTAFAAEAPLPRVAGAIAPQPIAYDWSGFHLGAFGGKAGSDVRATELFTTAFGGNFYARTSNPYGFEVESRVYGLQLGYDWQRWGAVFGVGVDLGSMDLEGQITDPNFLPVPAGNVLPVTSVQYSLNGALTGRVGFALDRFLIYARGGAAFVEARGTTIDTCGRSFCGQTTIAATGKDILFGWTVGGGAEVALSDHWHLGAEYRIHEFEDLKVSGIATPNNLRYSQTIALDRIHSTRAFVNYRW